MTLGGPSLDDLASGIPAGLHHALADATTQSGFLDDLVLSERRIELRHHDVAVGVGILADLLELFFCFYFQSHSLWII